MVETIENKKLKIVALCQKNIKWLPSLMKDCFNQEVSEEYFFWKYFENPSGHAIGNFAVNMKNEPVAFYGVIPEKYIIEGKQKIIFQSCDTMTRSDHLRKGLFYNLASKCFEEIKSREELFLIGFSGRLSTLGFLKLGWCSPFSMINLFKQNLFIKNYKKCCEIKKISELEGVSEIQDIILKSNNYAVIHSSKKYDFLNWRLSNPNKNYKIYGYRDGLAALSSYVIISIEKRSVTITDFFFDNDLEGRALINFISVRSFRKSQNLFLTCYVRENSEDMSRLLRCGMWRNRLGKGPFSEKLSFIFLSDYEQIQKYKQPNFWHLSAIDHDSL